MEKALVLEKNVQKQKKVKQKLENDWRKYHKTKKLDLKYETMVPLYEMWQEYFKSFQKSDSLSDERLLKADYHGCLLHVSRASNPSQIGIRGIVVRESRNTFLLINPRNKLLSIPKQGTVFQFVVNGQIYGIYGDAFKNTSAARVTKRVKNCIIPELLK